jgi:uncharacterized protein
LSSTILSPYMREKRNILIVTGQQTVQATPDEAIVTLGVITENTNPETVQRENSTSINNIIQALTALAIPKDNVKTVEYRIDPQYDYQEGKQIFKGYKATHLIQITVKPLTKVGTVIDAAVKNGANTVTSVRFSLSNPESYYNRALSDALKIAYHKAISITNTLGTTLNTVPEKVEEISPHPPPIPYQTASLMKADSVPIQPGELNITASVRVKYSYH